MMNNTKNKNANIPPPILDASFMGSRFEGLKKKKNIALKSNSRLNLLLLFEPFQTLYEAFTVRTFAC